MTISQSQIQNHGGRAANHYSAPWVGVLRRAVPLPRNDAKRSDEFFHPKCKMHKCKRRIRFAGMSLRKWMDSVAGLDKAEYIYRVIFKSGPQDARRMDNTCIFPLQKAAENSIFWPRIHTTWHPHFKPSLQHPSPRSIFATWVGSLMLRILWSFLKAQLEKPLVESLSHLQQTWALIA